jgi:hypothetical protein
MAQYRCGKCFVDHQIISNDEYERRRNISWWHMALCEQCRRPFAYLKHGLRHKMPGRIKMVMSVDSAGG